MSAGTVIQYGGRNYVIVEEKSVEDMRATTPNLAADMEAKGRVAWVTFRRGKGIRAGKWCAGWRMASGDYVVAATVPGQR